MESSVFRVQIQHALQLHAELAGVGLSIATPETEVLYMLLDGIRVRATSSKVSRTVEACIRSIQVSSGKHPLGLSIKASVIPGFLPASWTGCHIVTDTLCNV